jgi:hypothetical protein
MLAFGMVVVEAAVAPDVVTGGGAPGNVVVVPPV